MRNAHTVCHAKKKCKHSGLVQNLGFLALRSNNHGGCTCFQEMASSPDGKTEILKHWLNGNEKISISTWINVLEKVIL